MRREPTKRPTLWWAADWNVHLPRGKPQTTANREPHQWITHYDNVDKKTLTMQLHTQEHTRARPSTHAQSKHTGPPHTLIVCGMKGVRDPYSSAAHINRIRSGLGRTWQGQVQRSVWHLLSTSPETQITAIGWGTKAFWTLCCSYKYIPMGERWASSSTEHKINRQRFWQLNQFSARLKCWGGGGLKKTRYRGWFYLSCDPVVWISCKEKKCEFLQVSLL